ncbi:MAG: hypothetical protein AB1583_12820 [Bacteroidota bacterium]
MNISILPPPRLQKQLPAGRSQGNFTCPALPKLYGPALTFSCLS